MIPEPSLTPVAPGPWTREASDYARLGLGPEAQEKALQRAREIRAVLDRHRGFFAGIILGGQRNDEQRHATNKALSAVAKELHDLTTGQGDIFLACNAEILRWWREQPSAAALYRNIKTTSNTVVITELAAAARDLSPVEIDSRSRTGSFEGLATLLALSVLEPELGCPVQPLLEAWGPYNPLSKRNYVGANEYEIIKDPQETSKFLEACVRIDHEIGYPALTDLWLRAAHKEQLPGDGPIVRATSSLQMDDERILPVSLRGRGEKLPKAIREQLIAKGHPIARRLGWIEQAPPVIEAQVGQPIDAASLWQEITDLLKWSLIVADDGSLASAGARIDGRVRAWNSRVMEERAKVIDGRDAPQLWAYGVSCYWPMSSVTLLSSRPTEDQAAIRAAGEVHIALAKYLTAQMPVWRKNWIAVRDQVKRATSSAELMAQLLEGLKLADHDGWWKLNCAFWGGQRISMWASTMLSKTDDPETIIMLGRLSQALSELNSTRTDSTKEDPLNYRDNYPLPTVGKLEFNHEHVAALAEALKNARARG